MIKNLFDNWYVDWNFTAPTEWRMSDFTYTIYMEDDDFCSDDEIEDD